nr:hypothetical protein [uncultured Albidiferax sp.]
MTITFTKTKRGMSIRATGRDANALFNAIAQKSPDQQVADWNNAVHVGQAVDYRGFPDDAPQRFKTRTLASVLSGHTAVVWLEGKSGCVTLESCAPVVEGGAQ